MSCRCSEVFLPVAWRGAGRRGARFADRGRTQDRFYDLLLLALIGRRREHVRLVARVGPHCSALRSRQPLRSALRTGLSVDAAFGAGLLRWARERVCFDPRIGSRTWSRR